MKLTDYKKLPRIKCIYALYDNIDKLYIGSTADLRDRAHRHYSSLLRKSHHSKKLQEKFDEGGDLSILILDLLVSDDINEIEIEYIKKFNSVKNGYNMILDSRNTGKFKQSEKALSNFKKARSIKVVKLTLDGDFVEEFDSVSDASKSVNSQSTNISKCCSRKGRGMCKGFIFMYKSDYDKSKKYKYKRYSPREEHLSKIIKKAATGRHTIKVIDLESRMIFESISKFERLNNLYEGYVKYQYRRCGPKNFKFEVNGKNYVLKKYEDMV